MVAKGKTFTGKPCKRGHTLRYVSGNKGCVECGRARSSAWGKANADRVRAKSAAWEKAHPETSAAWRRNNAAKIRARSAAWDKANPDRRRANAAAWRVANADRDRERHAGWYLANKEKRRAYNAAQRKAHPERGRVLSATWRKANPDRNRANQRAYYRANPEKFRRRRTDPAKREKAVAYTTAWKKRNRAAANAGAARHNARKRNAPGRGVSGAQWQDCLAASLGLCAYCNEQRPLQMEHIEPLVSGGAHDTDNIVSACRSCNSSKNDTPLAVWLALRASTRAA